MRAAALVVFNVPILTACICLPFVKELGQALREKPSAEGLGAASYSRIAGVFGAVAITSLFWASGNLLIWVALDHPEKVTNVVDGFSRLFMAGAALVLPYGFNQLRSMINPPGAVSGSVGGAAVNVDVSPKPLASGVIVPQAR
jgi:hypothetical protein